MAKTASIQISTGIKGLDEILRGGLTPGRAYLVRGGPGAGKTTLGLQYLIAGRDLGERTLFITLEEPEQHIRQNAERRNLDLSDIAFLDLSPSSDFFADVQTYDIFSPADVEREPLTQKITDAVAAIHPSRVFLDPMTQFRYLSSDVFQFRRQVLSFLRFLMDQDITVVFTSEGSADAPDDDLQFMSDGVINLEMDFHGRWVNISKFRSSDFVSGRHSLRLVPNGMEVYPRLLPEEHAQGYIQEMIPSGIAEVDGMLAGGIERGAVTLLSGPSGVGKTTLGLYFIKEAAQRGERSVLYSFEEEVEIMLHRCEAIGISARQMQKAGQLKVVKVEPLRWSPDEFALEVRREVEEQQARVIMLDSIAGYLLTMRDEALTAHLHALIKYLQNMGIAVLLITETATVLGEFRVTDLNNSHLADNIVFLRYLEIGGQMRKAIGVLKKRQSDFEKALREFEITAQGIRVGEPLTQLHGILLGTPEWAPLPRSAMK